jgi:hypothetical protein
VGEVRAMIIYKFTNKVNGKVYIGQTRRTFEKRISEHKMDSRNIDSSNYNCVFYRAIRKHGWDKFEIEIIDEAFDIKELNEKESYWISFYNSLSGLNGYNSTTGGDSPTFCDLSRLRMAEAHGGKPFMVFDLNGNFIKTFSVHSDCAKELGISFKHITTSLKGKYYSLGGYILMYEDEYSEDTLRNRIELATNNNRHGSKNVNSKLTRETVVQVKNMLMQGKTQKQIALKFGVDRSNISSISRNLTWKSVVVDGWEEYIGKDKRAKGSRIGNSNLSEEDVIKIKKMLIEGASRKSITSLFSITYNGVVHIDTNSTWKHVVVDGWSEYLENKKATLLG